MSAVHAWCMTKHSDSTGLIAAPAVLRCTTTADFLAALPFLAGFTAQNSLFVVCFRGKRGSDAMRIELPDRGRTADMSLVLRGLIELLRETGAGAATPAIVLTTDRGFADNGAVPHRSFCARMLRRLHREGWSLRELAVIATDGWATMLGPSTGVRRSLDEIAASPISQQARRLRQQPQRLDELSALPATARPHREAVARHLADLAHRSRRETSEAKHSKARAFGGVWMHGVARIAESCFDACGVSAFAAPVDTDQTVARVNPRLLARLIEAAQTPDRWLVLALTALTRAEFVVSLAEAGEIDMLSEMPIDHSTTADKTGEWNISSLLLSLSHEEPKPARLHAAIGAFAEAAAHAPDPMRPAVLALLAWAWWMLGMQSAAQQVVRQSLAIDAEHELTRMVQRLSESPPAARLSHLKSRLAA